VWVGIGLTYALPKLPASFTIMATSTLLYAGAALCTAARRGRERLREAVDGLTRE
jgi:hypothetical protein